MKEIFTSDEEGKFLFESNSKFTRSYSYRAKRGVRRRERISREQNSIESAYYYENDEYNILDPTKYLANGRRKSASFSDFDTLKQSLHKNDEEAGSRKQSCPEKSNMMKMKRQQSEVAKVPDITVNGKHDYDDGGDINNNNDNLERLAGETDEDAEIRKAALLSRSSRSRSSTVVVIPTASIQMDLHTLYMDSIKNGKKGKTIEEAKNKKNEEENEKKSGRFATLMHKFKRDDNNNINTLDDFRDFLEYIRRNLIECEPHELAIYKESHWSTLIKTKDTPQEMSDSERRRFEALWELFYAEITYLIDHLLVLQNVFAKSYEHARAFGFLPNMDEVVLFANLEKLIEVTSYFAKNLLRIFSSVRVSISSSTEIIVSVFQEFDTVLTPEYNAYCINYQQAKNHIATLKDDEVFNGLTKWCEQHALCNRLHLEDFLVAPLQHLTKYPLLLKAIRKQTPKNDNVNNKLLTTTIISIEKSVGSIEKKISSVMNLQRLQQIQNSIKWPSFTESDQKCLLPEYIKSELSSWSCESLLLDTDRKLVKEGSITLMDNNKSELYIFLFHDMILMTKIKKGKVRRNTGGPYDERPINAEVLNSRVKDKKLSADQSQQQAIQYHVFKQPIPLDRMRFYDVTDQTSSSLKNSFCCLHMNRYNQVLYAYTFQANSEQEKKHWVKNIKSTLEQIPSNNVTTIQINNDSISLNNDTSPSNNEVPSTPPISLNNDTLSSNNGVSTSPPISLNNDTSSSNKGVSSSTPISLNNDTSSLNNGVSLSPPISIINDTTPLNNEVSSSLPLSLKNHSSDDEFIV